VVTKGEFRSVTGPSGSGKSSLLYLLGLLDAPTSGETFIEGAGTSGLGADALAALRLKKIGFVFQFHYQLPEFTDAENVMLDTKNSQIVQDIFARLVSEQGRTVIAVTHEENFARATPRNIHLVDGRIAKDERR
jgi:lipoprotein-releasing system ATP-binding protein